MRAAAPRRGSPRALFHRRRGQPCGQPVGGMAHTPAPCGCQVDCAENDHVASSATRLRRGRRDAHRCGRRTRPSGELSTAGVDGPVDKLWIEMRKRRAGAAVKEGCAKRDQCVRKDVREDVVVRAVRAPRLRCGTRASELRCRTAASDLRCRSPPCGRPEGAAIHEPTLWPTYECAGRRATASRVRSPPTRSARPIRARARRTATVRRARVRAGAARRRRRG